MDLQETFAVDRPASRREPVLELPRWWLPSAPAESVPHMRTSPAPVANTDTAVAACARRGRRDEGGAARASHRAQGSRSRFERFQKAHRNHFQGTPRRPRPASRVSPLGSTRRRCRWMLGRRHLRSLATRLAVFRRESQPGPAARDAVGATDAAPIEARPVDSASPGARPSPAPSVPGSGRISGLRLDGSQDVLLNHGTFLVGRHPDCDVYIDSRDVGRRHAQLHVRDDTSDRRRPWHGQWDICE